MYVYAIKEDKSKTKSYPERVVEIDWLPELHTRIMSVSDINLICMNSETNYTSTNESHYEVEYLF